jgi:ADYC domain
MRISSWLTLVCCMSGCAGCPPRSKPSSGTGANPGSAANPGSGQCTKYQFLPPAAPELEITCPREVCGLNGSWLGAGVPFRTLHLHGAANPQGLAILWFTDGNGNPMTIDLTGDVLTGRPADGSASLTGTGLIGASLFLGPAGGKPTFRLTIDSVSFVDFWAQCPSCGGTVKQAPHYHFIATSLADGCQIALCDPALEHRPNVSIVGTTVMFRGDFYDDATYQVSDAPAPDRASADGDLFNIACEGTAIYKLYMLRHSVASASSTATITPPADRTALLRLLTADYCGSGHTFTVNGVPIQLGTNSAMSPYQVTRVSGYDLADGGEIDAQWTAAGAVCLGKPRLANYMDPDTLMRKIKDVCSLSPSAAPLPPPCGTAITSAYATSANPR